MAGLVRYDLQQAQGSVITPHEEYTEQKTNPWLGVLQGASGLLSSGLSYAASKEAADAKSLAPLNEGIQKLVTARDQGVEPSQLMKMEKEIIPTLANTYTPSQIQSQMDLYGYSSLSKKSGAETSEGLDAQRVIQKNIGESILGPDATSEAKQKAGQDALANLARTEQAMSEIQAGRTQEEKNEAADLNLRYLYRDAYNTATSILNRQNYSLESYTAAKQLWVQNMQSKTGLDVNSLNAIFERGTATLNSAVSNQEKTVEDRKKAVETANELTESLAYQKFLQQPVTYRDPVTDKVLTTTGDKMMAFAHKIPLENLKVLMGTPEGREVVSAMFAPGQVTTDVVPSLYLKSAEVGNILSKTDKETADRIDVNFKEGLNRIIEEAADTPKEDLMEQGSLVTPAKFNEIYGNLTSEQLQQSPEYADVLADRDNLRNKLFGATVTALSKITDGRAVLVDEDGNFRLFESDRAGFKDVTDMKDSWFNFGARGRAKAFDGTAAELRKMFFNLKKFGYSGKEISDMFNKMSAISSEEFRNVKVRRQAAKGYSEAVDRVLTIEEAQQYADEALGKKTQRSQWIDEAEAQRIRESVAEELPGVGIESLEDVPENSVITTDTADFLVEPVEMSESFGENVDSLVKSKTTTNGLKSKKEFLEQTTNDLSPIAKFVLSNELQDSAIVKLVETGKGFKVYHEDSSNTDNLPGGVNLKVYGKDLVKAGILKAEDLKVGAVVPTDRWLKAFNYAFEDRENTAKRAIGEDRYNSLSEPMKAIMTDQTYQKLYNINIKSNRRDKSVEGKTLTKVIEEYISNPTKANLKHVEEAIRSLQYSVKNEGRLNNLLKMVRVEEANNNWAPIPEKKPSQNVPPVPKPRPFETEE